MKAELTVMAPRGVRAQVRCLEDAECGVGSIESRVLSVFLCVVVVPCCVLLRSTKNGIRTLTKPIPIIHLACFPTLADVKTTRNTLPTYL